MNQHRHLTPEQVTTLLGGSVSEEALRLTAGVLIGRCAVCLEMIRQSVGVPGEPRVERRPGNGGARPGERA